MKVSAIQVGRICVKTKGRETGKKCVIVDLIDKNFVLVTGPKSLTGVKRRRANVDHIHPLEDCIEIPRGGDDEAILKIIQEQKKVEAMLTEL